MVLRLDVPFPQALRGCLYGNKKLVELPFLDDDMSSILSVTGPVCCCAPELSPALHSCHPPLRTDMPGHHNQTRTCLRC